MSVLLVTYDLNRRGQNYGEVLDYIKQHPWARVSESSYAIETRRSVGEVSGDLQQIMDKNDTVYVFSVGNLYSGYGPPEVNDWLEQRL